MVLAFRFEDRSWRSASGAERFRGFGAAPVWPFRGPSPGRRFVLWNTWRRNGHRGTVAQAQAILEHGLDQQRRTAEEMEMMKPGEIFNHFLFFFGCHMLPLKYRLHGDSVENDVCQFHGVRLKSICIYLFISSWFEKFPPRNSFRIALPFGFFWLEVQPRSCFGLSLEGTSWHKPCVRASKRRRRSPCLSWKWKEPPVCDWSFMPQSHHHHHQCFDDCPSSKHTSR